MSTNRLSLTPVHRSYLPGLGDGPRTADEEDMGTKNQTAANGLPATEEQSDALPNAATSIAEHGPWLTSFVGRDDEVRRLVDLVRASRVVTLVGQGGMGKTRLATQVAESFSGSRPVHVVHLADLRDPDLLTSVVLASTQVAIAVTDSGLAALLKRLDDDAALLVLDNCEHVLDAAATFVQAVCAQTNRVTILATSRQPLTVAGERILNLQPLTVPPSADVEPGAEGSYSALRLFIDRATAVQPTFEIDDTNRPALIALCRQLDGMPLAIELAAVRMRVLSINEIAARISDRFALLTKGDRGLAPRHQTLLATMDWSFALCSADEQVMWATLSVFEGGFTLAAAEQIHPDQPPGHVLDVLTGLVEKSVLIKDERESHARFRMLETVRQYGISLGKLAGTEGATRERHRRYCFDLLTQTAAGWFGPDQLLWTRRLWEEYPNIRAALDDAYSHEQTVAEAARLTGRHGWFLWICIFLPDGRHWLSRAREALSDEDTDCGFVAASLGYVEAVTGSRDSAIEHANQAALIAEARSCPQLAAYARHVQGLAGLFAADPADSSRLLEEALVLYATAEHDPSLAVAARQQLALALIMGGRVDEARAHLVQSEAAGEGAGALWEYSYALYTRGLADLMDGDAESALKLSLSSLEIKLDFHDTLGIAMTTDLAAWALAKLGRHQTAAKLLGRAERLWSIFGDQLFDSPWWAQQRQDAFELCVESLGEAQATKFWREGPQTSVHNIADLVLDEQRPVLSPRELEVARLVAEGKSTKEMADAMSISPRTVEAHVDHIFAKLDVRNRAQIAAWIAAQDAS